MAYFKWPLLTLILFRSRKKNFSISYYPKVVARNKVGPASQQIEKYREGKIEIQGGFMFF